MNDLGIEAESLDWDHAKAVSNRDKHGVLFDAVRQRFVFDFIVWDEDTRFDYGESRYRIIGFLDGRLHVLVAAPRGNSWRLISARKANEKEIRHYVEES
jgi:uncharacterized protein